MQEAQQKSAVDADQESPADAVVTPSALRSSVDWVAKHWTRVRLGHEAVMLDRVERIQRISEITARNTMTGKMDDTSGWPSNEEGDKMGVKIGDEIHHHYPPAPAPAPAPTPAPNKADLHKADLLTKAVLIAALIGLGAGAVTGVLWLAGTFDQDHPVIESPTVVDTDTTRKIEIEVWR